MKQQRRTATRPGNGNFEALYQDIERMGGAQHAEATRSLVKDFMREDGHERGCSTEQDNEQVERKRAEKNG